MSKMLVSSYYGSIDIIMIISNVIISHDPWSLATWQNSIYGGEGGGGEAPLPKKKKFASDSQYNITRQLKFKFQNAST